MQFTKLQIIYLCINIANCFVLHDRNNMNLKKYAHHFKDADFRDADYEMINREHNKPQIRTDTKVSAIKTHITKDNTITIDQEAPYDDKITFRKTTVVPRDIKKHPDDTFDYNYNDLVQEYYLESAEDRKNENAYYIKTDDPEKNIMELFQKLLFLDKLSKNCTEEETKGYGIKALKCIIQDYKYKRQSLSVTTERLWRIIKMWFILYFLVALPIWFTGGWCCCCLCCKIFKPHKTIKEARNYLLMNPPGIFKDKYGETRYLPSEKEKDKFEEFQHLLKTI